MQLKRLGMETFVPHWNDTLTLPVGNFCFKIARHFTGNQIKAGKLRGYEFTRPIAKKKYTTTGEMSLPNPPKES